MPPPSDGNLHIPPNVGGNSITHITDFMKLLKNIHYIFSILLVLSGVIIKLQNWDGGNSILALGLLGILVYFVAKLIKDIVKKRNDLLKILLLVLIVLMSVLIFAKYLWYGFSDYPGLIVVPLFIFTSLYYFIKGENRELKIITTSILYLLLSIPLFINVSFRSPREYFPSEWYNRYQTDDAIPVKLPYGFKYIETEQLSIKAHKLRESKMYYEAINIYKEALVSEPKNPILLFDLSETYARINNLEQAVALLDTAIMVDSTYSGFYNNRGLLYYKLDQNDKAIKDYLKAIEIDSTITTFYYNIALAYYYEDNFVKACESINKVEQLGFNLNSSKALKRIKRKHCN